MHIQNLLVNRKITILAAILNISCVSSTYKIHHEELERVGIVVSPDRVSVECEDVQDGEEIKDPDGRYGFSIEILDDENTVLSVIQGNVLDRKFCQQQLNSSQRILKSSKLVYVAG